jgi:hypothetical protein
VNSARRRTLTFMNGRQAPAGRRGDLFSPDHEKLRRLNLCQRRTPPDAA